MLMETLLAIYLFAVGASFGSFALLLADRMHAGKDWIKSRSVCDHCGHQLGAHDLVPLLSWIMLGGKCRYCQKKISVFFPLVEAGLGAAFVVSYLFIPYDLVGVDLTLFVLWLFGLVIMAALIVSDLKWFLLPSKLVYPLTLVAFMHRIVAIIAFEQALADAFIATALALVIGAGLFWVLNKVSGGRWIGDGDYRLGVAIALFLGDPVRTWMVLFFASVFGLLFALPILVRSGRKVQVKIPFGPFLILGLGVSYLVGQQVIDWYSRMFLQL